MISWRKVVDLVVPFICAGVGLLAWRASHPGPRIVVIRRPSVSPQLLQALPPRPVPVNIAPLATVTVSSVDEAPGLGEGVADGTVDSREWISNGELRGAWIRLDWDKPATIEEIELYDRPSAEENLTSGSLTFDDGSMVGVPPLPPDGSAWRVSFPPKTVRSLVLRIDSVEGRSAGLAEIMVFGTMNP